MKSLASSLLRFLVLAIVVLSIASLPALADTAQPAANVTITGTVVDQNGSLPIANAVLELQRGAKTVATTRTNQYGIFTFNAPPEVYTILVRATGYSTVRSDDIVTVTGRTNVTMVLRRAENTGDIRQIGRVTVTTHGGGLQTTTTIQHESDPQTMLRTNQIRISEGLAKLPGVNPIGQDSAVGDDIGIDIRGLKPSETQVLLDGHPIGPLGVYPGDIGGGTGGFNFQDSPLFAVQNSLVTYGSGAVGLYGVDAVGGSVDLQTFNPTVTPESLVKYGFGDQGKQLFAVQTSATDGKLGYVFLHGVSGTYGDFQPQLIAQTGARGSDFTSATLAQDTYLVTGNYTLRNDLAKLRYAFSPQTSLTLTAYSATSWDDKTGNGDNDFITPEFAQFQAQTNTNCSSPTVPAGITVQTDAGTTCVTPQQYAAGASGPAGGGPGAFQAIHNQDYHARLLTSRGKNQFVLDAFVDNYGRDRVRPASFLNGANNILTDKFRTIGMLISDDIATEKNDVGFGFYSQRQYVTGNRVSGDAGFIPSADLFEKLDSFFVRDAYTPSEQLSIFANAWLKHSLIGGNSFDPRVSFVYRPRAEDVIRLTGGGSSADPAPIATTFTGAGGINPGNCQQFSLGTVPSSNERPEKAQDLEFSLAHRFVQDTTAQLTLYDTNETDTIFEGQSPAAGFLDLINTNGPTYLPGVFKHISLICPNFGVGHPPPTIANLFVNTNLNLASSRARGLELSGRLRATPHFFMDGYYDVQSTVIFDAPDFLLMDNPTLINGSQLERIPLHKYGISADLTNTTGGEVYLDYTHYDNNNGLLRPAYGVADISFTQRISEHTSLNLGISNLFDTAVDNYGRIGLGVFVPENAFGTDANALQQGSERFGLAPASISLTLTQRI